MLGILIGLCAVIGLAVGSFLNVVIWRVPRGESVVRPPSHCPQCDHLIRERDNIPVVSWLLLRGRCRDCGTRISARYPLVELATGILFAVTGWHFGWDWQLPAYLYLAAIAIALAMIDIDERRLPNAIVLPSYPVLAVLLLVPTVVDGRWDDLLRAVAGGALAYGLFFVLCLLGGMGFGDVKLVGLLGAATAFQGWGSFAVGLLMGFVLGGVYGIALMLSGRAGRKSKMPYGPFLLAGAFIGVLLGQQIADQYLQMMGI